MLCETGPNFGRATTKDWCPLMGEFVSTQNENCLVEQQVDVIHHSDIFNCIEMAKHSTQ
jgi:hypothetical protein